MPVDKAQLFFATLANASDSSAVCENQKSGNTDSNKRLSIEKYDYCVKNGAIKSRCIDIIPAKGSEVDLNVLTLVFA